MNLIDRELESARKYVLDTEIVDGNTLVKLNQDNVARVEAMIISDSEYRNTFNSSLGILYKKGKNKDNLKSEDDIKYIGSSAYWGSELRKVICSLGKSELKEYLYRPKENNYKLIDLITNASGNEGNVYYSFATKLCHYACMYVVDGEEKDNFSIYDRVIKSSLPMYIERYLNKSVKEKVYDKNYIEYIKLIDEIRDKLKENNEVISRNGLDHLLWYHHKGDKIKMY